MGDDRGWTWDEQRGEIRDGDGELLALVVSSSAADPGDGDGPIMAAGRDLLTAGEAILEAFGGDIPDWLHNEADGLIQAIEKARKP